MCGEIVPQINDSEADANAQVVPNSKVPEHLQDLLKRSSQELNLSQSQALEALYQDISGHFL